MGGAGSKRTGSNSRETNNRTSPKEKHKRAPFIVENASLSSPTPLSPTRRRGKFSKRTPDADSGAGDTPPDCLQHAGGPAHSKATTREAGKIETLVRGGVKSIKDWKMISSRGSRSAAPLTTTPRGRCASPTTVKHTNQFSFHHESYIAQTRQETVDFPSPRHLLSSSPVRHPLPEYKNRNMVYEPPQHLKSRIRQQSPDNIPPPSRYDCRKDLNTYYSKTINTNKQNSPSYLYSLELKQRSCAHDDDASNVYDAPSSRAHSPEYGRKYKEGNTLVVKPSRDNVNNSDSMYPTKSMTAKYLAAYSTPADKEEMPIFLPRVAQDLIIQRVEVKPDLEYSVIKPKTIRVNGIEYVRKKSNHQILKQLLTVDDKNHERVATTFREKSEKGKSRKAGEGEKQNNTARHDRSKSRDKNDLGMILEKGVEKYIENGQVITHKSRGSEETKEEKSTNYKYGGDKNVLSKTKSETKRGEAISTRDKVKGDDVKSKDMASHENERKVTARSTPNVVDKKEISQKKDTTKQAYNANVLDIRDMGKRENASRARDKKDFYKHEKRSNDAEKNDRIGPKYDAQVYDRKVLSKADQELLRQCRIKHMPISVSSTGRLFLPSMKFMATPLATMVDNKTIKLTACASEKSYSRYSHQTRLSPHRPKSRSPYPADRESTQRHTGQSSKQNATKNLSSEQEKGSSKKAANESKENFKIICTTAVDGSITLTTKSRNSSPRSNSPKNRTNLAGRTSPKVNTSRHDLSDNKEPNALKDKKQTEQTENHVSNGNNLDTTSTKQEIKDASEGEIQTDKQSQKHSVAKDSSSKESSCSNGEDSKSSHKSMEASWYSKSVRSKNKIFETIIERSSSLISASRQDDHICDNSCEHHHCNRRMSSPHIESSDTPFSKAIKHKYRTISAKRLSRPESLPDPKLAKILAPHVFTPWDSCMMFKPSLSRTNSPPYKNSTSHLQPRQSESIKSQCMSSKLDLHRARNDDMTSKSIERIPIWKEVSSDVEQYPPPQAYQSMSVLHESKAKQSLGCNCELAVCQCIEMKGNGGSRQSRDDPHARCGFSKLNREKVIDFEEKFKNTHVYRSVTGESCQLPGVNNSFLESHGRPLMMNKGSMDLARALNDDIRENTGAIETKRKRRCSSCGKNSNGGLGRDAERCKDCGGPLDKSSDTDSSEEVVELPPGRPRCGNCGEKHDSHGCTLKCCAHCHGQCGTREEDVSGNGSSSGLSAKSGQVPPYEKVLKMFETKSKCMTQAEHASRHQWPPLSERTKVIAKPASRVTRHHVVDEVPSRSPRRLVDQHARDVIIERRRHRSPSMGRDGERYDPHFNRSEQELFRNARLQWMARDKQKLPRHLQGVWNANYTGTSSSGVAVQYDQQGKKHRMSSLEIKKNVLKR